MSPVRYAVRHETLYRYHGNVAHSHQQLHLTPRNSARQRCFDHRIRIAPQPLVYSEHMDGFGNLVTRFELDRPHDRLQVVAEMEVDLDAVPQPPCSEGESWEQVRAALCYQARSRDAEWLEAQRFRGESPYVRVKRLFGDFARGLLEPSSSVLEVANGLMNRLHEEFTYTPGATEIATPLLQVLEQRRGVCQDYAHLMIACLRSVGLAARYVSGYLHTGAPPAAPPSAPVPTVAKAATTAAATASVPAALPGAAPVPAATPALTDPAAPSRLVGADASHAWVAVFAPPFGWIEFDPTNNLRVAQEHVALAWGRDFGDVSPLRGVILGGGEHSLTVRVAVEPRPS
jgi:transglutaminase-like putative cysteine protease